MRKLAALLLILSAPLQRPSSPAARFQLVEATIDDVRDALASKQITCRALVAQYIARINAYDKSGPSLNTVQTINPRALQEADRLDTALASSGPIGPLHCVPMLVKDQVETSDMPTMYGSAVFKDFVPQRMRRS